MKPDDETVELFKFLSRGNKLKIYPGSHVPADARFQVCTSQPVSGSSNHESVCFKCKQPVYFSDHHPDLTKICIPCFLNYAKTHETESVANMDSLVKAVLSGKRN